MENQKISKETAILCKEKGFDIPVYDHFDLEGDIQKAEKRLNWNDRFLFVAEIMSCPTQSLVQRWLRETKKVIVIVRYIYEYDDTPYSYFIYNEGNSDYVNNWTDDYKTYEEALEAGLQEALKDLN